MFELLCKKKPSLNGGWRIVKRQYRAADGNWRLTPSEETPNGCWYFIVQKFSRTDNGKKMFEGKCIRGTNNEIRILDFILRDKDLYIRHPHSCRTCDATEEYKEEHYRVEHSRRKLMLYNFDEVCKSGDDALLARLLFRRTRVGNLMTDIEI